jgi:hypothetical protein
MTGRTVSVAPYQPCCTNTHGLPVPCQHPPLIEDHHPYTCEWCDGEWPSQIAYADHFSSLTHEDPDHPYQLPERKEAR